MTAWAVTVVVATVTMNAVSGVLWVARPRRVLPGLQENLATIGVPESWATFPIGTAKLAGAAGLVAGLAGVPYVGAAASGGLILFWVCAVFSHLRVADRSTPQFYATSCVFLPLAAGSLAATVV